MIAVIAVVAVVDTTDTMPTMAVLQQFSQPHTGMPRGGQAAPYELGLPSLSLYNWPNLYPVYVRGETCLLPNVKAPSATASHEARAGVLTCPIRVLYDEKTV